MDIEGNVSNCIENESSDSENEEVNINNTWNINYYNEKDFWRRAKYINMIYMPNNCPTCKIGQLEKKENLPLYLINPFHLRCNYFKCQRKVNLRNYSIFLYYQQSPTSIIYLLIKLFIIKR